MTWRVDRLGGPPRAIRPVFDDPNVVSDAGLVPVLRLVETAGRHALLGGLSVELSNTAVNATSAVGGMLTGAHSVGCLEVLRQAGGVDGSPI